MTTAAGAFRPGGFFAGAEFLRNQGSAERKPGPSAPTPGAKGEGMIGRGDTESWHFGQTALPVTWIRHPTPNERNRRFLSGVGIMAMLNMLYYLRSERSWDFVFGIFYAYFSVFALFWIFPYALITLRSRSWLAR